MKKRAVWILTFIIVILVTLGSSCKTENNITDNRKVDQKVNLSFDIKSEFIFPINGRPTPSCHASTIAQAQDGTLITAWFGGTKEKNKDVTIWISHCEEGRWSKPVEVADGKQDDGSRYPCWNPVLFQPVKGPLMLFYKVGPSPKQWWGMLITSENCGKTWSSPRNFRKTS